MSDRVIDDGPLLALTLRARRTLLALCTALGCAAAGATMVVGAQRGAGQAHLATRGRLDTSDSSLCTGGITPGWCDDASWWSWPPDKNPVESPPTAILPATRRPWT